MLNIWDIKSVSINGMILFLTGNAVASEYSAKHENALLRNHSEWIKGFKKREDSMRTYLMIKANTTTGINKAQARLVIR